MIDVGSAGTAREELPTGKVDVGAAVAEGVAVADQESVLAADRKMLPVDGAAPVMARNGWGRDFEMWPAAEGGWCGVMRWFDHGTGREDRMRWWMPQAAGDAARQRYLDQTAGEGEV